MLLLYTSPNWPRSGPGGNNKTTLSYISYNESWDKEIIMKFETFKRTPDIFKPGTLTSLAEEIYSGKPAKDISRLTPDQFAQLPSIYGTLDPVGLDITQLEDKKVYKTSLGKEILGADIKAITMLMYDKPRTAYIEFGREKQVHNTALSGAVPIPMLGFKRFRNIEYDRWRSAFDGEITFDPETLEMKPKDDDSIRKAFKIDMLLGKTLASTFYDREANTIKWKGPLGLLALSALQADIWKLDVRTVKYFREYGMGNHKGNFATAWGTARLPDKLLDPKVEKRHIAMWNKAENPMRLMLAQRWAWYGNHRNTDMICSYRDWDIQPVAVDGTATAFIGLKPQDSATGGIGGMFGIGATVNE